MENVGEELTTEVRLAGQNTIRSQGLDVFVDKEVIELFEGRWKNSSGLFNSLEEAVLDAMKRHEGCQGS